MHIPHNFGALSVFVADETDDDDDGGSLVN